MKSISTHRQSGAVSLFVVVFAMLLITIVTVSFLRLMVGDLRQSTNNDLSQSAYDSAMAGTEDAKRALLYYDNNCPGSDPVCAQFVSSTDECNAALRLGDVVRPEDEGERSGGVTGEIKVQQTETKDAIYDQAYTCVKIELDTLNVEGVLASGASKVIPLKGKSAFNRVQVSWYSRDDVENQAGAVNVPARTAPLPLGMQSEAGWPSNRPPILRTQFMQFSTKGFTSEDFDYTHSNDGKTESNANTVFLYPTSNGAASTTLTGRDIRADTPDGEPEPDEALSGALTDVKCLPSVASGNYACTMTLELPNPVGGTASDRVAFLHLIPFYKATHYEVRLFNSGSAVRFDGVQPMIDATGRANDLFRRVQSRVELSDDTFPYPQAAVDVTTEFCKDFSVTNTTMQNGQCSYN